jgi:Nitrile hydratase beta subunit, N-terminal
MDTGDVLQKLDPCRGGAEVAIAIESDVPGFGEPWHAQAWVEIFGEEIRTHPQRTGEGSEAAYYRQWLAALETILVRQATLTSKEIAEAAEHWRRCYLNTPHGKPIVFSRDWQDVADFEGEDHNNHHHHHGQPHLRHGGSEAPQPLAVSARDMAAS